MSFTGTLASMPHRQAYELVAQNGGESRENISRQVTMLVVGEEGWPLEGDGLASAKLREAVELMNSGVPLQILRESEWLRLIGLEQRELNALSLFTPAMLQQKLGIPVGVVRRWERLGLINAVQRVYRLPYFDFQEVSGVRRLQELLSSGIPRQRIEESLAGLKTHFPSVERPLAQLEILARDSLVLVRDDHGLLEATTGQRLMDFEDPDDTSTPAESDVAVPVEPSILQISHAADVTTESRQDWSAAEWFDDGCRHLETDNSETAIESFRMAAAICPDDPEIHFHLASALYRIGNTAGALERYHVAVELDHDYIESWTQLGCVRHELNDLDGAVDAFDIALSCHADYSEALYHKAVVRAEQNQNDQAAQLLHRYLELDPTGPWADDVRERLETTAPSS